MFIYGNWSSYDELSDSVILDEELALCQMSNLLRLRSLGVRFDAYLMDAFWYDPAGAYRTWRKTSWPNGPDRWFDLCFENGIKPGLWFTANTLFQMDLPAKWADSIDDRDWGLCLFQGGFLDDFMEVLTYWYEKGVRVFKLDFAEFEAVPKGSEKTEDTRIQNITAYRRALADFRQRNPEALILGYNGFEDRLCMDRSDNPPGSYIDPEWLTVLDSVYCGDPRPSDLPSEFWKSVDFYTDCMTRLYESSGIPLSQIDNCGFMAGPTGTCYWRGKAGWKEMLLLSLARGGKIHVAYADLSLFTDEDAVWWAQAQNLYAPFIERGNTTSFGGWPGDVELYGWTQTLPDRVLRTVVNPSLATAAFNPENLELIATNKPGSNRGELGPGGLAVYGTVPEILEIPDDHFEVGTQLHPIEVRKAGHLLEASFPAPTGNFRCVVVQKTPEGLAVRTVPSEGFPIAIQVEDSQGSRNLPPLFDQPIWSGISWSLNKFQAEGLRTVRVSSVEGELELRLYQIGP